MKANKQSVTISPAIAALIAALLALQSNGCGDNSAAIQAVQDAVQTSAGYSEQVNQDNSRTSDGRDQRSFSPTNPGRSNPFETNLVDAPAAETSSVNGISSANQITVMGFADVGTVRVMLRIGDQTKILKEGEQFSGVKVVSITPPKVQLKMDNLMWTATMFDERSK